MIIILLFPSDTKKAIMVTRDIGLELLDFSKMKDNTVIIVKTKEKVLDFSLSVISEDLELCLFRIFLIYAVVGVLVIYIIRKLCLAVSFIYHSIFDL